jgi:branched-chain amino acid transport system substrate-binding protein
MNRITFALLCILTAAGAPVLAARRGDVIVVGGLFSLTGDGATLGKASEAALALAARDVNAELAELGVPYRVQTVVADTKLTPDIALQGIQQLDAAGARIVVGPQSSAEAAAVRQYADEHDILLISQGSTASSLALPGDNLFRLAPNDRLEGAATVALMRADGVDVVVPIWRDDAGNGGLRNSVAQLFTAAGGVAVDGVSYAPSTSDFTVPVNALGAAMRAAKNAYPGKKIAVYLAAFEEGAQILDRARLDSDLARNWYGGDGLTQSQALLASPGVAAFAAAAKFTAPAVALNAQTADRWMPLSTEIQARTGFTPDAFSLSVYDAVWAGVLASVEARNHDAVRRAAFVRTVQRYWGVTGPLALDDAGDRKIADFDFWTVSDTGTKIDWVRTASYASGRIVR